MQIGHFSTALVDEQSDHPISARRARKFHFHQFIWINRVLTFGDTLLGHTFFILYKGTFFFHETVCDWLFG